MDSFTREKRSEVMRKIRSKDTKPEFIVRRLTHRMGYRYRLHAKDLPGKPDLVFRKQKKVIFVHGCFWHQHGNPDCRFSSRPKSNTDYWETKLDRNVARDKENLDRLLSMGWQALVVWECQTQDTEELATRIRSFLEA